MRRHAATTTHAEHLGEVTHLIDRAFAEVAHGRFERSLAGLTAVAAAVTTSEIYMGVAPREGVLPHAFVLVGSVIQRFGRGAAA